MNTQQQEPLKAEHGFGPDDPAYAEALALGGEVKNAQDDAREVYRVVGNIAEEELNQPEGEGDLDEHAGVLSLGEEAYEAEQTRKAEQARKAVVAEKVFWKKISSMTRKQVLSTLQNPDVEISTEDYDRVMELFNKSVALKKQGKMGEAQALLLSTHKENKFLLKRALRSKKLTDRLKEMDSRDKENLERSLFDGLEQQISGLDTKSGAESDSQAA